MKNLLEELSELEHDQWVDWSKTLAEQEKLSKERKQRWEQCWVPYKYLSEPQKEQDREWARKVINIVQKHIGLFK